MGMTSEGVVHGVVEHIMVEGGTLGTPGSDNFWNGFLK